MTQYRTKPVVVEAVQIERKFCRPEWLVDAMDSGSVTVSEGVDGTSMYEIPMLGMKMYATQGDWIIRDGNGELFACNSVVFAAAYEAV